MDLRPPPNLFVSLLTLGIARASWIAETNRALGAGGAGFLFAWLLSPFAVYGLAERLNGALQAAGSSHRESPVLCFLLNGMPFFGARARLKRGTERLSDVHRVGRGTPAPSPVG